MIDLPKLFAHLKRLAWFLPGFILWAAYPPMGETTDCLFALAPLMLVSRRGNVRESVIRWTQNGALFWMATLSWMPAIVKNGGPWALVVLGWVGLAAYCTLYFAAYGWLSARAWQWAQKGSYARRLAVILLAEPVLWAGLEIVRSRFGGGFAWNQLGVVPVNAGFGAPASIGGVYLLSAAVILLNGTLAGIAERVIASLRRERISRLRTIETVLAFALVFGIYGLPKVFPSESTAGRAVRVALLQRNFPCVFQARESDPESVYSNMLANAAAFDPELLVMSESAMSEFGKLDGHDARGFAARMGAGRACVLAGGVHWDAAGRCYNSAALYGSCPELQISDKVHLVPFGEFIPGDKWFPVLQKLAPVGSCTPGEPKVLDFVSPQTPGDVTDRVPIGVAICFEDTDSALMRTLAEKGARALFFVTNDSWFSHSIESVQHAWQAVARAIETGLPVVRVGNSGVTGTITPEGRAVWMPGPDGKPLVDSRGTHFARIVCAGGESGSPTPYVRIGDTPLFVAFCLLAAFLLCPKRCLPRAWAPRPSAA